MRVDISSFGAKENADCTAAIQSAIDQCAKSGGGEVCIPNGRFLTGTIQLRTGVTLELSSGAILCGSGNPSSYSSDVHRSMYVGEQAQDRCLIFACGAARIGITGRGRIDGQYPMFVGTDGPRPMLIRMVDCQDVLIRDVRLTNAASTSAAILYSQDVCIDNVRVHNQEAADGDGLVIDGCRDVRISGGIVESGRDAICIHASRTDHVAEHIAISNVVLSAKNSGLRVGMISVGTIRNLAVNNCVFHDIDESAISVQVTEGGIIENIRLSNLVMREVQRAAFVSLNRHHCCVSAPSGIPPMGAMRGVHFSGVQMHTTRRSDRRSAFIIVGSRDGKIENVSICDVDMLLAGGGEKYHGRIEDIRELGAGRPEPRALGSSLPAYGLYARHVDGLSLKNLRFRIDLPDGREAQVLDDVTTF